MSCSFEVCGDKATRNPKDSTVGTSGVGTPEAVPVKDSTVGISEGVSVAAITFIKNERRILKMDMDTYESELNQIMESIKSVRHKLNTLLENLLDSLYFFAGSLSTVVGSPEGAPALDIMMAAEGLLNDIDRMNDSLEGILSQQNFTA